MKVNGFQVEEHGSGYAVTLRLHVGHEELADNWIGDLFARVQVGGNLFAGASDTQPPADTPEPETTSAEAASDEKPKGRQRRRPGARKQADPTGDTPKQETSSAGAATGGKGRKGRRASTKSGASASSPSKDPTKGAAATAGRRSKTEQGSATAKTAKSPSDADISKAASLAANDIGSPAVMDILEEFGVTKVNELTPEQRNEFIDKLLDARNAK